MVWPTSVSIWITLKKTKWHGNATTQIRLLSSEDIVLMCSLSIISAISTYLSPSLLLKLSPIDLLPPDLISEVNFSTSRNILLGPVLPQWPFESSHSLLNLLLCWWPPELSTGPDLIGPSSFFAPSYWNSLPRQFLIFKTPFTMTVLCNSINCPYSVFFLHNMFQ